MIKTEWHTDNTFDGVKHLAMNVKDRSFYRKTASLLPLFQRLGWDEDKFNALANAETNLLREDFWNVHVQAIALRHGFSKVISEGRSNGWAVLFNAEGKAINEEDITEELLSRYKEFCAEVKSLIDNADNTLYATLKWHWSDEEWAYLKTFVSVRYIELRKAS